jgi:hypothetical protein
MLKPLIYSLALILLAFDLFLAHGSNNLALKRRKRWYLKTKNINKQML